MTERAAAPSASLVAVLFDLDGTLVDSLPGIEYALRAAIADVLPGTALPPVRSMIGPPVREMFRQAVPDASNGALEALERAFRCAYDGEGYCMALCYPGAGAMLTLLMEQEIRRYVVTNKPPEAARRVLAHLELDRYFTRVVSTGDWLPERKTKAEATRWLLAQERLTGPRCLFVGDSPDDAEAARVNNIPFLAATYGYGGVRALPGDGSLTDLGGLCAALTRAETNGAGR